MPSCMKEWLEVRDCLCPRCMLNFLRRCRTSQWSLPAHLHERIDTTHLTNAFFGVNRSLKTLKWRFAATPLGLDRNGVPKYEDLVLLDQTEHGRMDVPKVDDIMAGPQSSQACNPMVTSPFCLQTMYGTLDYIPHAPGKAHIGLVIYLDEVQQSFRYRAVCSGIPSRCCGRGCFASHRDCAHGLDQHTPITAEQEDRNVGLEGNLKTETFLDSRTLVLSPRITLAAGLLFEKVTLRQRKTGTSYSLNGFSIYSLEMIFLASSRHRTPTQSRLYPTGTPDECAKDPLRWVLAACLFYSPVAAMAVVRMTCISTTMAAKGLCSYRPSQHVVPGLLERA